MGNKDINDFYVEISFFKIFAWILYTFLWLIFIVLFVGGANAGYFTAVIDRTNIVMFYIFWSAIYVTVYILLYVYTFKKNSKKVKCVAMYCLSLVIVSVLLGGSVKVANLSYTKFSTISWQKNINERKIMVDDLVKKYNVIGMSASELINLLGKPDGTYNNSSTNCNGYYYYSGNRTISFFSDNNGVIGNYEIW